MTNFELKSEAISRVKNGEPIKKVANDLNLRERNINR